MKRISFIVPIMVVVAILAMFILERDHSQLPIETRILITAGGSIVAGIITYFLLRNDVQTIDPKPNNTDQKKR